MKRYTVSPPTKTKAYEEQQLRTPMNNLQNQAHDHPTNLSKLFFYHKPLPRDCRTFGILRLTKSSIPTSAAF
ncbi:hypothetical protein L5515_003335 [Caenorhabditis briggsae]|uniref:Uncharacterized protein n=1 Tax=Caenorhabditis briggsae TaxID=6238 RepID=A0AAE9ELS2_CAEBR|nr:hypothetical protein L5515_003335 [Caenorhabditis briggsae]